MSLMSPCSIGAFDPKFGRVVAVVVLKTTIALTIQPLITTKSPPPQIRSKTPLGQMPDSSEFSDSDASAEAPPPPIYAEIYAAPPLPSAPPAASAFAA